MSDIESSKNAIVYAIYKLKKRAVIESRKPSEQKGKHSPENWSYDDGVTSYTLLRNTTPNLQPTETAPAVIFF